MQTASVAFDNLPRKFDPSVQLMRSHNRIVKESHRHGAKLGVFRLHFHDEISHQLTMAVLAV